MSTLHRAMIVVATATLGLGVLSGCAPAASPGPSSGAPSDVAIPTPTATPTTPPEPVFVAPADCHVMVGSALETEFAGKGIVLFNSTNGEGQFAFEAPVTQQGANAFSCVWGVPNVDLNSFGLETQSLAQQAHEGVVAVLEGSGFDRAVDGDIVTYSHVGAETGAPEDQSVIHVLHPDGWITGWSTFGGQTAYDRLLGYIGAVTAQVYPTP